MPKVSKEHQLNIIAKIREYRKAGKTEDEIMHDLALIYRTYRRYIKEIQRQDKEAWQEVVKGELEGELLKLRASLENTFDITNNIANTSKDNMDVMEACRAKDDARLSIVQLIQEGPDYFKRDVIQEKTRKMGTSPETKETVSK